LALTFLPFASQTLSAVGNRIGPPVGETQRLTVKVALPAKPATAENN
jgi:hypothetical protein